jgi:hypothetical protein
MAMKRKIRRQVTILELVPYNLNCRGTALAGEC